MNLVITLTVNHTFNDASESNSFQILLNYEHHFIHKVSENNSNDRKSYYCLCVYFKP